MCGMTLKAICLVKCRGSLAVADEDVARLLEQLVHAALARARNRLVGRDHHPLDLRRVVQRLQRHHQLRGRAVRVGDDVLLRDSRRSLPGSPPARSAERPGPSGTASCCRSPCSRPWRRSAHRFSRLPSRRRTSAMSQPAKSKCSMVLDLELLAAVAEVDHVAGRARRGDRRHLVERELPLGQDVQDLATDIAGRSDDRDPVTHILLRSACRGRLSHRPGESDMALPSARAKGGCMRRPVLLLALVLRRLLGGMAAKPCARAAASSDRHTSAPGEFDASRARGPARDHPRRPAAASRRLRRQTTACGRG